MTDLFRLENDLAMKGHTATGSKIGRHLPQKPPAEKSVMQELLFFAYRDFTSDPDAILAEYGFGRAHHRVLHFVGRSAGLTVAELLDLLGITKQSLARVLKQLIDAGHVEQKTNTHDRRQRELYLTEDGESLLAEISRPQHRRIQKALEEAGPHGREAVVAFLRGMINDEGRRTIFVTESETLSQKGVQLDERT